MGMQTFTAAPRSLHELEAAVSTGQRLEIAITGDLGSLNDDKAIPDMRATAIESSASFFQPKFQLFHVGLNVNPR